MLLLVVTFFCSTYSPWPIFVEAKAVAAILGPDGTPYARSPYLFEFTFPKLFASFGGVFLTSLDVGRCGAQGAIVCFCPGTLIQWGLPMRNCSLESLFCIHVETLGAQLSCVCRADFLPARLPCVQKPRMGESDSTRISTWMERSAILALEFDCGTVGFDRHAINGAVCQGLPFYFGHLGRAFLDFAQYISDGLVACRSLDLGVRTTNVSWLFQAMMKSDQFAILPLTECRLTFGEHR